MLLTTAGGKARPGSHVSEKPGKFGLINAIIEEGSSSHRVEVEEVERGRASRILVINNGGFVY